MKRKELLLQEQRYKFFSNSQLLPGAYLLGACCYCKSKDTNFSAIHNIYQQNVVSQRLLLQEQRYKFFSNSQLSSNRSKRSERCYCKSKDTNFSAIHNSIGCYSCRLLLLLQEQRYKFFSNSQPAKCAQYNFYRCYCKSKDTNFSAIHNNLSL